MFHVVRTSSDCLQTAKNTRDSRFACARTSWKVCTCIAGVAEDCWLESFANVVIRSHSPLSKSHLKLLIDKIVLIEYTPLLLTAKSKLSGYDTFKKTKMPWLLALPSYARWSAVLSIYLFMYRTVVSNCRFSNSNSYYCGSCINNNYFSSCLGFYFFFFDF